MTSAPAQVPPPLPPYPLPVARIARELDVHRRTLQRALQNDPGAPRPADHTDNGHPLYLAQAVKDWWPLRRLRGRPAQAPPAGPNTP
ncbi:MULTISPECIES: hypothetical protein [unclassified Streptomyces]|uniref:hypothetical protein n=1 Tax=unclassified Streptomyces TaxID=2593676 RepID=UPI00344F3242